MNPAALSACGVMACIAGGYTNTSSTNAETQMRSRIPASAKNVRDWNRQCDTRELVGSVTKLPCLASGRCCQIRNCAPKIGNKKKTELLKLVVCWNLDA